jgi:hypothetical protein
MKKGLFALMSLVLLLTAIIVLVSAQITLAKPAPVPGPAAGGPHNTHNPTPPPTPAPAITDNRINTLDTYETRKAIYANNGIFVYDFGQANSGEQGQGTLICFVSEVVLQQTPAKPAENTLLHENQPDPTKTSKCQIWKLTTGEYQVNVGPEENGLVRVWIWEGVPFKVGSLYYGNFTIYG